MNPLTPGAQIDELCATLRISEQRRQRAEARLADRERQLGLACATIASQDQEINDLRVELAWLRGAIAHSDAPFVPGQLAFDIDVNDASHAA